MKEQRKKKKNLWKDSAKFLKIDNQKKRKSVKRKKKNQRILEIRKDLKGK